MDTYYLYATVHMLNDKGIWEKIGYGSVGYCEHIMKYPGYHGKQMKSIVWGWALTKPSRFV